MEEYIADENGAIHVPGVEALYPPGTRVFYENGAYSGHHSPIIEPPKTEETQPIPVVQVEPDEHVDATQVEGN